MPSFEACREVERSLSTELHDHADGVFAVDHVQHMFKRQRLEVQTIGRVVIGGHGFRIAVVHDGFIAHLRQGKRRLTTAVIKLDPLTDSIRSAAEDQYFLFIRRPRFIVHFIRGIQIGRLGFEFCGTSVHTLEGGNYVEFLSQFAK